MKGDRALNEYAPGTNAADIIAARSGSSSRSRGGAKGKAAGASLEDQFERYHAAAYGGRVVLARGHPETRMVPGRGGMKVIYTGKGAVDFVGFARFPRAAVVMPVAFDLKSHPGESHYRHDPKQMQQVGFLLEWDAAGGEAFLLVVDDVLGVAYALDRPALVQIGCRESVRLSTPGSGLHRTPVWPLHVQRGFDGQYDWLSLLPLRPQF